MDEHIDEIRPTLGRPDTASEVATADVVVGARCAGAATAMLLARAGHGVVIARNGILGSNRYATATNRSRSDSS